MQRPIKKIKLDPQIPIIFEIIDLLMLIIDYLNYSDSLNLRCCATIAFKKLPIEKLFSKKTKYLKDLKINPTMIARVYKNKKYLNSLEDKSQLDRDLLFKHLCDCKDLSLVSGVISTINPGVNGKYLHIVSEICLRFIGGPVTQRRISLINKYCDIRSYQIRCMKLDDVEYFKHLVDVLSPPTDLIQDAFDYRGYKILRYIIEHFKPSGIQVLIKPRNVSRTLRLDALIRSLGYIPVPDITMKDHLSWSKI